MRKKSYTPENWGKVEIPRLSEEEKVKAAAKLLEENPNRARINAKLGVLRAALKK